ncbi:uncharacterized protein LOC124532000 isoform X2 [Vanessa cardui]|uniref:uncharacterized protein LOC124532000 isoform X2 n=1 Tax=Vanessa cardui TaxID=171605 RepID=UPI001F12C60D|nr:uncharacterized protein LOC124532000 isoform X2 [Vanessa cardui]
MSNFNKEVAVNYVKTLVDNNRCVICDLLSGPIIRYPCGHFVCNNCAITAEYCIRCLSPPTTSTNCIDVPFGQRIEHVSHLLTTFQDLFNLDVYKSLRLSEQLKLEKEIFPKCIQAPSKYCNKRKSTKYIINDKENSKLPLLAGECVSNVLNMENTVDYVQQWLKNNESTSGKSSNLPRKPFADLNVNGQSFAKDSSLVKDNNERVSNRKRTHIKIMDKNSKKKLRLTPKNKNKQFITVPRSLSNNENTYLQRSKYENDESGIVVDEDSVVIDNSQEECIDKDRLAIIAVQEAEKLYSCDYTDSGQSDNNITLTKPTILTKPKLLKKGFFKIPFYKKSSLHKICNECTNDKCIYEKPDTPKSVTVIIDTEKFITTIKCSQCPVRNIEINKQSVQIQTNMDTDRTEPNTSTTEPPSTINTESQSYKEKISSPEEMKIANLVDNKEETLNNDENISKIISDNVNVLPPKRKCLIIEDSDTDSDIYENVCIVEATAEVHKEINFGVLSSMEAHEYVNRKKPVPRGHTPLSTDSSDKENYDPNRIKRQKFGKKKSNKKF